MLMPSAWEAIIHRQVEAGIARVSAWGLRSAPKLQRAYLD